MTSAKLRLATASLGKPGTKVRDLCTELGITRQTLYRHVSPTGEPRPDGEKLLTPNQAAAAEQLRFMHRPDGKDNTSWTLAYPLKYYGCPGDGFGPANWRDRVAA